MIRHVGAGMWVVFNRITAPADNLFRPTTRAEFRVAFYYGSVVSIVTTVVAAEVAVKLLNASGGSRQKVKSM